MPRRREARVPFAVPVRVTGTRRDGSGFSVTVHTLDISRHGVRLSSANVLEDCREVVTLHYMQRRARFRVSWRGEAGTPDQGLVGLTVLPGEPQLLWGVDPGNRPDTYEGPNPAGVAAAQAAAAAEVFHPTATTAKAAPPNSNDKRAVPRFDCDRAVICWRSGEIIPIWGKLRDISAGGCFMETPVGFPADTAVAVVLLLYGVKVRANGMVRTAGPAGMGIHFREVHARDVRKFVGVLNRLADPEQLPAYSSVLGPGESAFQKIKEWFKEHDSLSHEQFVRLVVNCTVAS